MNDVYTPKPFVEADAGRARALVHAHPFAALVVAHEAGVEISHLPFLLDAGGDFGALRGHVARANRIASLLVERPREVVVVFGGPHAYVTPRWYTMPREQVPTWNYAAVHAHGLASALDRADSEQTLADVSARFEAGAAEPWTLNTVDPVVKGRLVPAIVAFRVEVSRVEATFKLSQNKSLEERTRVIAGLRERGGAGDTDVAELMDANERARR
jgi:transcriptional regulator